MPLINSHARTASECLAALDASSEGLTVVEARRRLADHGPNSLPQAQSRPPLLRFLAQFNNVLIYVLLAAAAVTAGLQHWVDTGVILAVVLANAVIGFVQEGKAEAAMAAIRSMLAPAPPCCGTEDAKHWMVQSLCPATSCCWKPETRCRPICGFSRPADWLRRRQS